MFPELEEWALNITNLDGLFYRKFFYLFLHFMRWMVVVSNGSFIFNYAFQSKLLLFSFEEVTFRSQWTFSSSSAHCGLWSYHHWAYWHYKLLSTAFSSLLVIILCFGAQSSLMHQASALYYFRILSLTLNILFQRREKKIFSLSHTSGEHLDKKSN